ncbi:hypothetical protein ACLB2K_077456 [Fragaria x ananassa]
MTSFVTYAYIILSTSFTTIHGLFSEQSPLSLSALRMEKHTRLHFYFHDIQSSQNLTAIRIVRPPNKPVDSFGTTFITDDALTEKPEASSKLVGTLSILGRNPFKNAMREMPIVGGSGVFRYARGYALARTFSFNPKTGDAVVQYNVSVLHY